MCADFGKIAHACNESSTIKKAATGSGQWEIQLDGRCEKRGVVKSQGKRSADARGKRESGVDLLVQFCLCVPSFDGYRPGCYFRLTMEAIMKTRSEKVDVPVEHYDRLFIPVACVVSITSVDTAGRVNAASFATCVRVHHEPTCIAFCVDSHKDTYRNVLATNEFVVNIPSFDREILEKVGTLGLPFAAGVNELERAGLTALPSRRVKPPRIAEYKSHFECQVEWTKEWFGTRLMVVGRVVAASVDADCIDENGWVVLDKLRPVHYCGQAYCGDHKFRFVASYQVMEVDTVYQGPEASGQDPRKRQLS